MNQETRPIYECRYDERLKTKDEKSTRLGYTGLMGELEHPKIKTRLIDEMFASVIYIVYYESRKREIIIRLMNEGRSDERLKTRVEESPYL